MHGSTSGSKQLKHHSAVQPFYANSQARTVVHKPRNHTSRQASSTNRKILRITEPSHDGTIHQSTQPTPIASLQPRNSGTSNAPSASAAPSAPQYPKAYQKPSSPHQNPDDRSVTPRRGIEAGGCMLTVRTRRGSGRSRSRPAPRRGKAGAWRGREDWGTGRSSEVMGTVPPRCCACALLRFTSLPILSRGCPAGLPSAAAKTTRAHDEKRRDW